MSNNDFSKGAGGTGPPNDCGAQPAATGQAGGANFSRVERPDGSTFVTYTDATGKQHSYTAWPKTEFSPKAEAKAVPKPEPLTFSPVPALPAKALRTFRRHLAALLPLRNPTGEPQRNAVMAYIAAELEACGRTLWRDGDDNIAAPPHDSERARGPEVFRRELRGVVAHTDSVSGRQGEDVEPVYNLGGVFRSFNRRRPMGGDDKVGVAVALTVARFAPYASCLFPADEEIGCAGSEQLACDVHDLLIECDRRGASDLVGEIGGVDICSARCLRTAEALLPHRTPVGGGMTDVLRLVQRGLARNAFNMSCGYFDPHTSAETVVVAFAEQALRDTWTLLHGLPVGLPDAPDFDLDPYQYGDDYSYPYGAYGSARPASSASRGLWDVDADDGPASAATDRSLVVRAKQSRSGRGRGRLRVYESPESDDDLDEWDFEWLRSEFNEIWKEEWAKQHGDRQDITATERWNMEWDVWDQFFKEHTPWAEYRVRLLSDESYIERMDAGLIDTGGKGDEAGCEPCPTDADPYDGESRAEEEWREAWRKSNASFR